MTTKYSPNGIPRDEGELEILRNRMVLGAAALLVCAFFWRDPHIISAYICYLSANCVLILCHRANIGLPQLRWFVAILLDVGMGYVIMSHGPEQMAFVYPIYLWMILGNGFRYGIAWLYIAAIVSIISFGSVVAISPYWQAQPILAVSLIAALLIIPAYSTTLIRRLSRAKEEAETASKAKSYFLASISHELRTPLNAIIGYGSLLEKQELTREQHQMAAASVSAGRHLLHLIEQLLYVSTSQSTEALKQPTMFRPVDLLVEVRDMIALRTEEKGLAIILQAEPDSDDSFIGAADPIRNILVNLAGNAVKFTERGSVTLRCTMTAAENGSPRLAFSVSDTGIGIARQSLDKIFEPFQQADDTVLNRFGGTGLGLAICRQLSEDIGARLDVASRMGEGSQFSLIVPVERTAAAVARSAAQTRLLAVGPFSHQWLGKATTDPTLLVDHSAVGDADALLDVLRRGRPGQWDVAAVEAGLGQSITADHGVWDMFRSLGLAPVLVAADTAPDQRDLALRAEFASIIPPDAAQDSLRRALRIGCSFGRAIDAVANVEPGPSAAERPALRPIPPGAGESGRISRRILVADDNRTNRMLLAAILEGAGHSCLLVNDGSEALSALEAESFDIALLDVNMPVMNGIDTARLWRQSEDNRRSLPIIAVTADATLDTAQRCMDAGMNLRITKPVDSQALLAAIDQYCGNTDTRRAAEAVQAQAAIASSSARGTIRALHSDVRALQNNNDGRAPGDNARGAQALSSAPPTDWAALDNDRQPPARDAPRGDPAGSSAIAADQLGYLYSLGGSEFIVSLLGDFRQDSAETMARMDNAVATRNLADVRFAAHALKSVAANVGARRLTEIARSLELMTAEQYDRVGSDMVADLVEEMARVAAEVTAIIAADGIAPPITPPITPPLAAHA